MWELSCYLLLALPLLSANGGYTLLPAALDLVTFSRFRKKKNVLTERGFVYNSRLILRV